MTDPNAVPENREEKFAAAGKTPDTDNPLCYITIVKALKHEGIAALKNDGQAKTRRRL